MPSLHLKHFKESRTDWMNRNLRNSKLWKNCPEIIDSFTEDSMDCWKFCIRDLTILHSYFRTLTS